MNHFEKLYRKKMYAHVKFHTYEFKYKLNSENNELNSNFD